MGRQSSLETVLKSESHEETLKIKIYENIWRLECIEREKEKEITLWINCFIFFFRSYVRFGTKAKWFGRGKNFRLLLSLRERRMR